MYKKGILFILSFTQCLLLFSETIIKEHLNGMRKDDILVKQQIEFKDPGRDGSNVVWEFSKLKFINDKYQVKYFKPLNSKKGIQNLESVEHNTRYKYLVNSDSLLYTGFENSSSKLDFANPLLLFKYPFRYKDSIQKTYNGFGKYMNTLYVEVSGETKTIADATGTLILPDEDTVRNVLRVRTEQHYIQKTYPLEYSPDICGIFSDSASIISTDSIRLAESDTIYIRTVSNKWYAPGYRYPLYETISSYSKSPGDSTEKDDIGTGFYYPGILHSYLDSDQANKNIRDSILSKEKSKKDQIDFNYNYFPNPVRTNLNVEILLEDISDISFRIYDTEGNLKYSSQEGRYGVGLQCFTINTSTLRFGTYILHITANNLTKQSILIKL
jgi:hypothetical protein